MHYSAGQFLGKTILRKISTPIFNIPFGMVLNSGIDTPPLTQHKLILDALQYAPAWMVAAEFIIPRGKR